MNEIISLLKSHSSVRKYKDKEVEPEKLKLIIEAAQSASTSSFIQAYTIIRVTDAGLRKKLAYLSGEQDYVEKAPEFFVFCADLSRLDMACEIERTEMLKGYTESFILATVDTAIAAQNAMVAAEALGLGGVYIGGIRNNPVEISEILEIPQNAYPVFGMCIGYPDENHEVKPRLPVEIVLKENKFDTESDIEKLKEYDKEIKDYYLKRTHGKREDTWTGLMARKMEKENRPFMREFLRSKGFEMK